MHRILLVKTSSLGDVVHNLPVVSDLRAQFPDAEIDWAVERMFAEIPELHGGVSRVIAVEPRRWRRRLFAADTWREIRTARAQLQARNYDAVVDTQGLIKSALVACMAPGRRYGLDWSSSREPLRPFYHRTFRVAWDLHAVDRNRRLVAQALGYAVTSPPDYGLDDAGASLPWLDQLTLSQPLAVLLHATSAKAKLWPEQQWVKLGDYLHYHGVRSILTWGNDEERRRSERIAKLIKDAVIAPRLTLHDAARLLQRARVVFGVDTGLSHLAVAVGAPTVGIYCATDPAATGLYGSKLAVNVGGKAGPPAVAAVIAAWQTLGA